MYKAYVDNDIFFASDADQDSLRLTTANLTLQAGSSGEFVFTIPPCNRFYGQFEKIKSYVDVYRDDELVFPGAFTASQKHSTRSFGSHAKAF